ncbi:MAG: fructose bisphosphate aldolase [Aestuariivirga sp.]|uniref:fructose bisphosphate aldolase n=1 Tax=Aestuariivirga sp. TaxID=2650926 RepID=UPI0025BB7869|nr:fructose bisphosphate aldolase [Aestuariivirga sp.]MCA3562019.1 fructose bisphosphate aldolase [Aestuariivirga sp.]
MNTAQAQKISTGKGFIAALDQSGGSTPKALEGYGIGKDAWKTDEEMFALMHAMRARIIKSPAFNGDRIIGAILFERTMDGEIDGQPVPDFLWQNKGVVPFLKIDNGLADKADGVRLMKPMPDLDKLLDRALAKGIFGTKMRSVIDAASPTGIATIVAQQFDYGRQILARGLMPIIEPEVTISIPGKKEAENILRDEILKHLEGLPAGQQIMLKLTIPSEANFFKPLIGHPKVMRVVALSGGYSRDEANAMLAQNTGLIASFSRALSEGLSAQQTDAQFNAELEKTVKSIYDASVAG